MRSDPAASVAPETVQTETLVEVVSPAETLRRANTCVDAGDLDAARALVEAALARWSNIVALYLMRARILEASGSRAGAMAALCDTLERFPRSARTAAALSRLCLRAGRLAEARTTLALAGRLGLRADRRAKLALAIDRAAEDAARDLRAAFRPPGL
jgi:tetratricopeptide (TPR) repeat protein